MSFCLLDVNSTHASPELPVHFLPGARAPAYTGLRCPRAGARPSPRAHNPKRAPSPPSPPWRKEPPPPPGQGPATALRGRRVPPQLLRLPRPAPSRPRPIAAAPRRPPARAHRPASQWEAAARRQRPLLPAAGGPEGGEGRGGGAVKGAEPRPPTPHRARVAEEGGRQSLPPAPGRTARTARGQPPRRAPGPSRSPPSGGTSCPRPPGGCGARPPLPPSPALRAGAGEGVGWGVCPQTPAG